MPAKLGHRHSERTREKIQASMLVNRLQDHAMGNVEMTTSQVQAAKILLDKLVSNAPQNHTLTGEDGGPIDVRVTVRFPTLADS